MTEVETSPKKGDTQRLRAKSERECHMFPLSVFLSGTSVTLSSPSPSPFSPSPLQSLLPTLYDDTGYPALLTSRHLPQKAMLFLPRVRVRYVPRTKFVLFLRNIPGYWRLPLSLPFSLFLFTLIFSLAFSLFLPFCPLLYLSFVFCFTSSLRKFVYSFSHSAKSSICIVGDSRQREGMRPFLPSCQSTT